MFDQDKLKGYVNDKLIFYGDKLWLLTREEQEIYEQENIYYKGWQTETGTSSLNEHAAGEIRFYTSLSNVLEKKAGHYNVGLLDAVNDLLQALGALEDGEVFYKEPKKMDTKSSVESVHDTYAWIDDIAERVTKKYETNKKEWVELNSGKLDLFAAIESAIQLKPNYFQIGMLDAINDTFKFLGIVEESEVFYLEFMGEQFNIEYPSTDYVEHSGKKYFKRKFPKNIESNQPDSDLSDEFGLDGNASNRYFIHKETNTEAIVFNSIERNRKENPRKALTESLHDWFQSGKSIENRYKKTVILLRSGSGFDPHIESKFHEYSQILSGELLPDDLKMDIQNMDDQTFRKVCFRDLGYDFDNQLTREEKENLYLEKMGYTEKTAGELLSLNSNILAVVGKRKDGVVETITVLDKSNNSESWRLLDLDDDGLRGSIDADDYDILKNIIENVTDDFF